jgi:hypothetical protein
MKIKITATAIAVLYMTSLAYAGTCELYVTRTACAGKEDVSYKKCNGKQSCTETEDASSAEQCASIAVQACANSRFSITKSKVISAKFEGKEIKNKSGKADFCMDYESRAQEFDQCEKK